MIRPQVHPRGLAPLRSSFVFLTAAIHLLLAAMSLAQTAEPPSNPPSDPRMKADILLIVAHPDDETAIGSLLAKLVFDQQKRVAIIYTNRGGGGGNTTGNEQAASMAAIREIEARQATAAFGIHNVWFLNGLDTPGQDVFRSLESAGHGAILEQVVRLVRLTRPEVILTWLPAVVAGENHGDHQAAGVVATEAFDVAGDPTVFPAQVTAARERTDINNATEGLMPWQPKKIYYFSDASHPILADGPSFNMAEISPSRKVPYYKLAAELHQYHLTQGDVSEIAIEAMRTGDFSRFRKWLETYRLMFGKAVVPCSPRGEIFEGITTGPSEFKQASGFKPTLRKGVSMDLGGPFAYYRAFWNAHDLGHLASLVDPELEIPAKSYVHIPLLLHNGTHDSVDVDLRSEAPGGWEEVSGSGHYRMSPGESLPVQTFFIAPAETSEKMQSIRWLAIRSGAVIGSVVVRIKVSEWTLPQ